MIQDFMCTSLSKESLPSHDIYIEWWCACVTAVLREILARKDNAHLRDPPTPHLWGGEKKERNPLPF